MSSGSRSLMAGASQTARARVPAAPAGRTARPSLRSVGASASGTAAARPSARVIELRQARVRTRRRQRRLRVVAVVTFVVVIGIFAVRGVTPLFQRALRDLTLPLHDSAIIDQQAAAKHLDPALVAAVIDAETGFDARTSPTGALGLMQVEPQTAQALAHQSGATSFQVSDLGTPAVNIAYGSYYLRELLNTFGGNEIAALAAYNGGETNVAGWIAAARERGQRFGLDDIPFPATRDYVTKVLQAQSAYRHKYAAQLGLS